MTKVITMDAIKTASFASMSAAFFDELAKIQAQRAEHDDETRYDRTTAPYCELTQDDEPLPYQGNAPSPDQPFVIIRR